MRELLLVRIDDQQYGIWKDEILSVKDLQTLHRLPLSPACVAGISIVDDRTVTLADLPVCIGYAAAARNRKGRILMLPGQEKTTGFLVSGDIGTLSVPDHDVFPVPEYVKTEVINSCAVHNSIPIPIINVSALYHQLLKPDQDLHGAAFIIPDAGSPDNSKRSAVRLMDLGGQLYAAPSKGREEQTTKAAAASALSRVPLYVKGIGFCNGSVLTVIDLPQRIKRQKSKIGARIIAEQIAGEKFGLLVDEDRGTISAASVTIADLPPIAHCSWLNAALLHDGQIIPLVELPALLSADLKDAAQKPLPERYAPDSAFHELFKRQDVDVIEFLLLGALHALPKCEVEDIFPLRSYRDIPETPEIVVGVAEHNGSLLPVLDLAMVFGRRSVVTSEWRMLLVKNGDFRALVLTETVVDERRLPLEIQRSVPIVLPHRVVYGCYPEQNAVRLILNVEAMAVHFEKSLVKELLPALSQEMKLAPAEIVHSLLDEDKRPLEFEEGMPAGPPSVSTASITTAAGMASVYEFVGAKEPAATLEEQDRKQEITEQPGEPETAANAHEPETETKEEIISPQPVADGSDAPSVSPAFMTTGTVEEYKEKSSPAEDATAVPEQNIKEPGEKAEDATPERAASTSPDRAEESPVEEGVVETASVDRIPEEAPAPLIQKEQEYGDEPQSEVQPQSEPEPERESDRYVKPKPQPEPVSVSESISEPAPVSQLEPATSDRRESLPFKTKPFTGEKIAGAVQAPRADQPAPRYAPFYRDTLVETSASVWKRRTGYGVIVAVLLAMLYFIGTSNRPGVQVPLKEAVSTRTEPVKAVETKKQVPVEQPEPPLVLEIPPTKPTNIDVYTVVKGDTLWSISDRFTGNPFNYPRIAGENRIANPDLIFPGQKIRMVKK